MNASEFIQYCKDKYVGKAVALKCPMHLYNKGVTGVLRYKGYINVIKDVCMPDLEMVKFSFGKYSVIFDIHSFREIDPLEGCRVVSDLFEIIDN